MMRASRNYVLAAALLLACGFLVSLGIFGPGLYRILTGSVDLAPDFEATLEVLAPLATASAVSPALAPTPPATQPSGRIVYTCQVDRYQSSEQICVMNADGSGQQRVTTEAGTRHYYPSLAPDGQSVVYSQYREDNVYEIMEFEFATDHATRLTDRLGVLTGPEISPDGTTIAFMRWTLASDQYQIWLMDRDGANARRLFDGTGWDPTWSPDGATVLFASDKEGAIQLFTVGVDGSGVRRVSDLPALRGRSDWSSQGLIATYSGEAWSREVYTMNPDGSGLRQVSPPGGNSQGPSFSPDGGWIAFTAYFDNFNDENGCEIYVMRIDGSDLRRLTRNEYCDYQPRWGP